MLTGLGLHKVPIAKSVGFDRSAALKDLRRLFHFIML